MNFGLSEDVVAKFKSVFAKYPEIEEVVIYGSRAKGNYREGSDIDITLVGNNVTAKTQSSVWLDLDGLDTPYLIDLSVFSHLNSKSLVDHIHRVGKTFYKKQEFARL